MLAVLIVLAALTAGAVGAPAIWLAREQLDRQAWARLEGGGRTLRAILEAELSDLANLALLTAQRPTLLELTAAGEDAGLVEYLRTLQSGAGLDLLALCRPPAAGGPARPTGVYFAGQQPVPEAACAAPTGARLARLAGAQPQGWMLASLPVSGAPQGHTIVVGHALDEVYLQRLRLQSGVEALALIGGQELAGSFSPGADHQALIERLPLAGDTAALTLGDVPYFARRDEFSHDGVEIITALSIASIAAAQAQLSRAIALGIVVVILAASALAGVLARRISRPLERLRVAAIALRKGDLTTPVAANTRVREIAQVAFALEDARLALHHTLEALRREKEWSDDLLASISEGIVTLDRSGRITFFSAGAEKLSGRPKERVTGKHIDDVFTLSDANLKFSAQLPARGGKRAVMTVKSGDGQTVLAVTAADLAPPEARRVGTALVLRDVSDEEAIRRVLGDFMANITHEFRTPLSALAASIELMLDQLPSLSEAEIGELLDSLRLGTLSLQTLIDNLLEGASIEAGRFRVQPRPADLGAVIAEAQRVMQPLLEKYRQTLALDAPPDLPPVLADPRRTGQVLVNLLSNAIKWSPEGSMLRITVLPGSETVTVSVADCGPGIPPEHLKDVFTRFAHLKIDDPRAANGAGLGLSVVKAIIEAQGGQVNVENRPTGGAAFSFTIPTAPLDGQAKITTNQTR